VSTSVIGLLWSGRSYYQLILNCFYQKNQGSQATMKPASNFLNCLGRFMTRERRLCFAEELAKAVVLDVPENMSAEPISDLFSQNVD